LARLAGPHYSGWAARQVFMPADTDTTRRGAPLRPPGL